MRFAPDHYSQLVIQTPAGQLTHNLDPDANVCALLARLAAVVPTDSTWTVRPPRQP